MYKALGMTLVLSVIAIFSISVVTAKPELGSLPVKASETDSSQETYQNAHQAAEAIEDEDKSILTISAYGSYKPNRVFRPDGSVITAPELADLIKTHPDFPEAKEIKLFISYAGIGSFAQELSTILDKPVSAPDNIIWLPDGLVAPRAYVKGLLSSSDLKAKSLIDPASDFMLTAEEIESLNQKSENKDAQAAFRLYQYYLFIEEDLTQSMSWLKTAAEANNSVAQYNLGYEYQQQFKDKQKAAFWFERSSKNGYPYASSRLKSLSK